MNSVTRFETGGTSIAAITSAIRSNCSGVAATISRDLGGVRRLERHDAVLALGARGRFLELREQLLDHAEALGARRHDQRVRAAVRDDARVHLHGWRRLVDLDRDPLRASLHIELKRLREDLHGLLGLRVLERERADHRLLGARRRIEAIDERPHLLELRGGRADEDGVGADVGRHLHAARGGAAAELLGHESRDVGGLALAEDHDVAAALAARLRLIEPRHEVADGGDLVGAARDEERATRSAGHDGGAGRSARGSRRAIVEELPQRERELRRRRELDGNHRGLAVFGDEGLLERVEERLHLGVLRIGRAHDELPRLDDGNHAGAGGGALRLPRTLRTLAERVAHERGDLLDVARLRLVRAHGARLALGGRDVERGDDLADEGEAITAPDHDERVALLVGAHGGRVLRGRLAGLGQHLLDRARDLARARMPQRVHLELVPRGDLGSVEALHELLDLGVVAVARGHEERRAPRIAHDRDAPLRASARGARELRAVVEELLQRLRDARRIGTLEADLPDRELARARAIEFAHQRADLLEHLGVGAHEEHAGGVVRDQLRAIAPRAVVADHEFRDVGSDLARPGEGKRDRLERSACAGAGLVETRHDALDLAGELRRARDDERVRAVVGGEVGRGHHDALLRERASARREDLRERRREFLRARVLQRPEPHLGRDRALLAIGERDEAVGERDRVGGPDHRDRIRSLLGQDAHARRIERDLLARGEAGDVARERDRERAKPRAAGRAGHRAQRLGDAIGAGVAEDVALHDDRLGLLAARERGHELAHRLEVAIGRDDEERPRLGIGDDRDALREVAGRTARGCHARDRAGDDRGERRRIARGRELDGADARTLAGQRLRGLLDELERALDLALRAEEDERVRVAVDRDGDALLGLRIVVGLRARHRVRRLLGWRHRGRRNLRERGGDEREARGQRGRPGGRGRGNARGQRRAIDARTPERSERFRARLTAARRLALRRTTGLRRVRGVRRAFRVVALQQFLDRDHLDVAVGGLHQATQEPGHVLRVALRWIERHRAQRARAGDGRAVELRHDALDRGELLLRRADEEAVARGVRPDHRRRLGAVVGLEEIDEAARDLGGVGVAQREHAHHAVRLAAGGDVELLEHLLRGVERRRRRGDHDRVEPLVGDHAQRGLRGSGARGCRRTRAFGALRLAREQFLDERRHLSGARVLQEDRAHARRIARPAHVDRADDRVDFVKLRRIGRDHERVARRLGRDHRAAAVRLRGRARGKRLLDRLRDVGRARLRQRIHADLGGTIALARAIELLDHLRRDRHQLGRSGEHHARVQRVRHELRLNDGCTGLRGGDELRGPARAVEQHRVQRRHDDVGRHVLQLHDAEVGVGSCERLLIELGEQRASALGALGGADDDDRARRGKRRQLDAGDARRIRRVEDATRLVDESGRGRTRRREHRPRAGGRIALAIELADQPFGHAHDARGARDDERVRARIGLDAHGRRGVGLAAVAAHALEHDARIGLLLVGEEPLHQRRDARGIGVDERERLRVDRVERGALVERTDELLRLLEIRRRPDEEQRVRARGRDHLHGERFARRRVGRGGERLRETGRDLARVGVGQRSHADDRLRGARRGASVVQLPHEFLDHRDQRVGSAHDERVRSTVRGDIEHATGLPGERRLDLREPALERRTHERRQRLGLRDLELEDAQRRRRLRRTLDAAHHLLDLREHARWTTDDERLRHGLHAHDRAASLGAELTGLREVAHGLRERVDVRVRHAPRADLGVGHRLRAVELLDELLEARHARDRRVDDQRVGLSVGAHHDLARLLELRARATARIDRHRRRGIHLVDRLRELGGARDLQREDADLAIACRLTRRAVERLDHLLDLGEEIGVRGDDQRVGLRLGRDLHRLRALLVGRALRVLRVERGRERGGVRGAELQDAHRRRGADGDVDVAHDRGEELLLPRIGGDEQRVGPIEDLDRRLAREACSLPEPARGEALDRGLRVGGLHVRKRDDPHVGAGRRRREDLPTCIGEAREGFLLAARDDRAVRGVDLGVDRRLDRRRRALGGLEAREAQRLRDELRRVGRARVDDAHATLRGHGLQLLEQLLGLLEGGRVARDDQRAARGLGLHQHLDRLRAVDAGLRQHAARGEVAQARRDALDVALLDAVRAQLRLRRQRRAIEFGDQFLEARATLGGRLDDERVRRRIGGDEHLLLLLEMRQRPSARVERDRRRWIESIKRRREFGGACALQRDDERLARRSGARVAGTIEIVDQRADLLEHRGVRGDDERVGGGIALDAHRLRASLLGRARVVALREHGGHLRRVASAQLEEAQRRQRLGRRDVEIADEALDERQLRRLADHVQRVRRLDHADLGRRHRARRIDRRRAREER